MSYFEYYETKADGTPNELPSRINYEDRRILFLRWKWSRVDLQHFIDLACAVPGTPVDVTHWENGGLVYSARMTYKIEGPAMYTDDGEVKLRQDMPPIDGTSRDT